MSQPPTFPPKKLPGEVDAAPRAETPGTPAPSPAPRFPASVVPAAPAPTPQTQTAPTSRFGAPTAPQSTTGSRFGAPASPQMPPSNRFGAPATPAGGGGTILAACPPSDARHGSGPQPPSRRRPDRGPKRHGPTAAVAVAWRPHAPGPNITPQPFGSNIAAHARSGAKPFFRRYGTALYRLSQGRHGRSSSHIAFGRRNAPRHGFCARRFAPEQPHFAQLCLSPSRQHTARDAPRHLPLSQRFADFG